MSDHQSTSCKRQTACAGKQDTGEVSFALEEGATTFTSGREFATCGNYDALTEEFKKAARWISRKAKKAEEGSE